VPLASCYESIRLGEKADSQATPIAGTAMMGGGKDLKKRSAAVFYCGEHAANPAVADIIRVSLRDSQAGFVNF
jgi:hypothetical protein